MNIKTTLHLYLVLVTLPLTTHAGWQDIVSDIKQGIKQETSTANTTSLSEQTIVAGLKQALDQGIDKSVKQLGRTNGFLNDASVKIPMPDSLNKVDKGLRKIGQDKVADKFINTMNHAAEQAVQKTGGILVEAVREMSLGDAVKILNGEQDAATQYFKRTQSSKLNSTIKPIVQDATNSVGLTGTYKKMMSKAGVLAKYIDQDSIDIDQYITGKTIDGLFIKIALEEKRIRENPVARTTDILKDVFGNTNK